MATALVIGGGRGIGAATVDALAEAGFDVSFTFRSDAAAAAAQVAALGARFPGRAFAGRALDLADRAAVEAFATRTASDPSVNPVTGADLGAGPGAGTMTRLED